MGIGAELRIFPGDVSGGDESDPSRAKATVVVLSTSGTKAKVRISARRPDAPAIALTDLAVLVRPSDDYVRMTLRLRPAAEPGGLSPEESQDLRKRLDENAETKVLVAVTDGRGDFELSTDSADRFVLRGTENQVRAAWPRTRASLADVVANVWQQARQGALLHLRGENGRYLKDNSTLQVKFKPMPPTNACEGRGKWVEPQAGATQTIPLCHRWAIEVTLSKESPIKLLVSGLILSTHGDLLPFPTDATRVPLAPGEPVTFSGREGKGFRARPPVAVQDYVMVFGTPEKSPVGWHLLAKTSTERGGEAAPQNALHQALERYVNPGSRGADDPPAAPEDSIWTLTSVPFRVEASAAFLDAVPGAAPADTREYSITNFDVRPYLPDDEKSALRRVLLKAQELVDRDVQYKQHEWPRGATDEANLAAGIDCSRAVWFAFTRAGVRYNRANEYLSTAQMVAPRSAMAEEFASCTDDPVRKLGDVLVYRNEEKGVGHTVMVIDPLKRVAWGSHGWDGNVKESRPAATGVEYQLIKYKRDWLRWDRIEMQQVACWRHRGLESEARGDLPIGGSALEYACDAERRCGLLK
jgi:hypothetical protein